MKKIWCALWLMFLVIIFVQKAKSDEIGLEPVTMKWRAATSGFPKNVSMTVLEGKIDQPGLFVIRAKFPPGTKVLAHTHHDDERITVLEGSFFVGYADVFDENKGRGFRQGSYIRIPSDTKHFVWTNEGATIQIQGMGPWDHMYVDSNDDPRSVVKNVKSPVKK